MAQHQFIGNIMKQVVLGVARAEFIVIKILINSPFISVMPLQQEMAVFYIE